MEKQNILLKTSMLIALLLIVTSLTSLSIIVEGKGGITPPETLIPPEKNDVKLVPITNSGYEDLAYLLAARPRLIGFIDFSAVTNKSLPQILKRTTYSYSVSIPSNKVYVKDGELYVSSVNHLIVEERAFKILGFDKVDLKDNIVVVAYIRIISGKSYSYARGGIGFFGKTRFVSSSNHYLGTTYWLSVLGSFTGRKLSYDFEGHWSKLNGRWFSSSTYRKFTYKYNKTYILWIAKVGNYIVGGIIDGQGRSITTRKLISSMKSYIKEDNVYKIDITAYNSKIAIKRIEVYKLEPIPNPINTSIKLVKPVVYSPRYALLQPIKNKVVEFTFYRNNNIIEFKASIRTKT